MSEKINVPAWFWILAILFLLWNILGVLSFIGDLNSTKESLEAMEAYSDREIELMLSLPSWTKVFYGLATFSGLIGAIGLIMKKRFAVPLFVTSLCAAVFHHAYIYTTTEAMSVMQMPSKIMSLVVISTCVLQLWFSRKARSRAWLS